MWHKKHKETEPSARVTRGCHNMQPALGALTFLRSFVAGKANFCSQLLASLVHFTVVKSQDILIIRLGVAEVISAVSLYLLPTSKWRKFLPRLICSGFVTEFRLCNRAGNSEHKKHRNNNNKKQWRNPDSGAFRPWVKTSFLSVSFINWLKSTLFCKAVMADVCWW